MHMVLNTLKLIMKALSLVSNVIKETDEIIIIISPENSLNGLCPFYLCLQFVQ